MADELEFDEDLLFSEFDAIAQRPGDFSSYQEETTEMLPSVSLKALQDENNRLRHLLNKLLVPVGQHVNTQEKPLFHAVFFNNKTSTEGRQRLEYYLKTLSAVSSELNNGQQPSADENESISVSSLQPSLSTINDFVHRADGGNSGDSKEITRHDTLLNYTQYFDIYCIDSCGLPVINYTSGCNEGWEIPLYEQVFFTAVPSETDGSSKVKVKRKKACFNCGSVGHNLSDCTEPQNLARIDSMRQQFIKKFSSPFAKDKRYHLDEKRFGSFKPGIISSTLREALGLRSDELPPYIYKMRQLGYPPGYIPSASNSTLLLYNADGVVEDYVMEDIDEDDCQTKEMAFVEYPGFNCPLPKGVKDRSREFGYPPMSPHQSIHEMNRWHRARLDQMAVINKKTAKSANKRQWSDTRDASIDMDLDEEDQGASGGILPNDATVTGRKKRKHNESDSTTDEGGYSPTRPNIQYGSKEKQLLEKIHQTSSTKPYTPNSKSSKINKNTSPTQCELTQKKNEDKLSLNLLERANASKSPEEGEIISDEEDGLASETKEEQENEEEEEAKVNQGWWLEVPLTPANFKPKTLSPPPLPSVKLPMDLLTRFYTSCTVLQKISFEDRIMWLDPIYGNIQVSTGRYDRLKEILQQKKTLKKGRR